MSTEFTNDHKRKSTEVPKAFISNKDEIPNERKTRRVSDGIHVHSITSTDASASIKGRISGDGCDGGDQDSLHSEESASNAGREVSLQNVGRLVQDLFHYGHPAIVRAALDALCVHLKEGSQKCGDIITVGGCAALVQLLKNCLRTATEEIRESREHPISEELLGELSELKTLHKTLYLVTLLMNTHRESRAAMTAIGGVERIVNVMKTFRNCQDLQTLACSALRKLARCNIGRNTAVEAGAMQVLLVAIHDHLGSSDTCGHALYALVNMVKESRGNTKLLISLGGAAAVVKVKTKWRDDNVVQPPLRKLAPLLAEELNRWDD
jgi:hypothetical protein